MKRYACIHGHFYQPPRENAWTGRVERQPSAVPHHDWNARILEECYAANARSPILDQRGGERVRVNNYARMSFNFGPTLAGWLQREAPRTYGAILDADRSSRVAFSGHGSAMAQVYNHAILPLCNDRDRWTQVVWGVRDFEHRFGRRPEGMWLAETAADRPSLEALRRAGLHFTILSPDQAARVRAPDGGWRDVDAAAIDCRRAYRIELGGGASIAAFFYDGGVATAVAFEGLLSSGADLSERLVGLLDPAPPEPQLAHIATDGESYGHHHPLGNMALAWTLHDLESRPDVRLTNYGEFLELSPPAWAAQIVEPSSWSCPHGVGRWKEDCGCARGIHPGWTQAWRRPLRESLDALRDTMAELFEEQAGRLLCDPWAARDDYIDLVLDDSPEVADAFFERHAAGPLGARERAQALNLLEMQRHALLMYTSCGWFFEESSRIETIQILQYAARAIELSGSRHLEADFLRRLESVPSNRKRYGNARRIFETEVTPARPAR